MTCHLPDSTPIEAIWRQSDIPLGMSELEHFEILGDYAVFRPTDEVTLERAVELLGLTLRSSGVLSPPTSAPSLTYLRQKSKR